MNSYTEIQQYIHNDKTNKSSDNTFKIFHANEVNSELCLTEYKETIMTNLLPSLINIYLNSLACLLAVERAKTRNKNILYIIEFHRNLV